jgi:hypothetical protein
MPKPGGALLNPHVKHNSFYREIARSSASRLYPFRTSFIMAAFQDFMQSQTAADAMKHDGGRPETIVVLNER